MLWFCKFSVNFLDHTSLQGDEVDLEKVSEEPRLLEFESCYSYGLHRKIQAILISGVEKNEETIAHGKRVINLF